MPFGTRESTLAYKDDLASNIYTMLYQKLLKGLGLPHQFVLAYQNKTSDCEWLLFTGPSRTKAMTKI